MTEEQKANDATRYIVVNLDILKIIGTYAEPGEARGVAEVQAQRDEGQLVAVFQKTGTARLEPKIVWKGAGA